MPDDMSRNDRIRQINEALGLLSRTAGTRRGFSQFGGDRKIDETLGYKNRIRFEDYLGRYERMGLAGAIVDRPAKTTWRSDPRILEADTDDETEFTEQVQALARNTRLWTRAEQADRLAGIRHYAVMLIGSTRANRLDIPLGEDPIEDVDDVGFFSVFREDHAKIKAVEGDMTDPRFGLPTLYELTLFGDRNLTPSTQTDRKQEVHWSRVVHVAEDTLEDDLFGRPRLQRVFNDLDDLLKTTGSSAEAFWLQVAGLLVATHADEMEVDKESLEDFEDDVLDVLHKITRFIQVQGTDLELLKPDNLPDPRGIFEVTKQLISAGTGQPQRIMFGSERGELASTQDEANWFGKIEERRQQHAEPIIIRPVIDRLIDAGALTPPRTGGYRVEWDSLFELSDLQEAEVQERRARTVKTVAEAVLAGGELAMEMAAALIPGLAEILEAEGRALNAFREEEDEGTAEEVERLLAEVADTDSRGQRRTRRR